MTGLGTDASRYDGHRAPEEGYGITLAICLPRDALSVPMIRHLVRDALNRFGVLDEITGDIQLALAEACTNVVDHAGPGDAYEVTVTIRPDRCELRVIDVGHGFDHATVIPPAGQDGGLTAERGRGLGLMHALADHIELVSEPETGTLVRLVKNLVFDDSAPGRHLLLSVHDRHDRNVTDGEPDPTDKQKMSP